MRLFNTSQKLISVTLLSKAALAFLAAFFIFTAPAWAEPEDNPTRFFWARVVSVADGDTITVVRKNNELDMLIIRIYGIDAPENSQPHGKQAANKLRRLINKKIVQIEIMQKVDRYGRIVGIIKHDGKDVARVMLIGGAAWVEPRYCKQYKPCHGYKIAAGKAKKAKAGLWRSKKPVPPWEWRKTLDYPVGNEDTK